MHASLPWWISCWLLLRSGCECSWHWWLYLWYGCLTLKAEWLCHSGGGECTGQEWTLEKGQGCIVLLIRTWVWDVMHWVYQTCNMEYTPSVSPPGLVGYSANVLTIKLSFKNLRQKLIPEKSLWKVLEIDSTNNSFVPYTCNSTHSSAQRTYMYILCSMTFSICGLHRCSSGDNPWLSLS